MKKQKQIQSFIVLALFLFSHTATAAENLCNKIFEDFLSQHNLGTSIDKMNSLLDRTVSPLKEVAGTKKQELRKAIDDKERELAAAYDKRRALDQKLSESRNSYWSYDVLDSKGRREVIVLPKTVKATEHKETSVAISSMSAQYYDLNCDQKEFQKNPGCTALGAKIDEKKQALKALTDELRKQVIVPPTTTAEQREKNREERDQITTSIWRLKGEIGILKRQDVDRSDSGTFAEIVAGETSGNQKLATFQMRRSLNRDVAQRIEDLKKKRAGLEVAFDAFKVMDDEQAKSKFDLSEDDRLQEIVNDKTLPEATIQMAKEKLKTLRKIKKNGLILQWIRSDANYEWGEASAEIARLESPLVNFQVVYDDKNQVSGILFPKPLGITMTNGCKDISFSSAQRDRPHNAASSVEQKMFGVNFQDEIERTFYGQSGPKGDIAKYLNWAKEAKKQDGSTSKSSDSGSSDQAEPKR